MSSRPVIWLLCAGAVILACTAKARTSDGVATDSAVALGIVLPEATPAAPKIAKRHGPLPAVHLETSLDVAVKQGARFTFRATNGSDRKVELHFASGQTHDFAVTDSTGREVWRWADGRMFTQGMQTKLLGSHGSVTFEDGWDAAGKHGKFIVVATIRSSDYPAQQRAEFLLP